MNMRLSSLLALFVTASSLAHAANEIGYVETFALATDREQALDQLIPGSEEYYFYHALHYQNSGQKEKFRTTMAQWAARTPNSQQRKIIENREALLNYGADPKTTVALLTNRLGLQFNHAQQPRDQKPNLPTALDPARISAEAFRQQALFETPDNLGNFEDEAIEELVRTKAKLLPQQRRSALARIARPDIPNLLDLIVEDLQTKESKGFGEYPIHKDLLPEQLDELALRIPSLYDNQAFVSARLRKFLPNPDVDLHSVPASREAWLDAMWNYAKNLSPNFNSLKASILFDRLQFDRGRGVYDKARFIEYLKLPRNVGYINPEYLKQRAAVPSVDLNADYSASIIIPPIRTDEWLVRDYLLHLLKGEASWDAYATYLKEEYVKPLFAEAKIVNGIGDPEHWAGMLAPSAYQALKDRVDLDFAPQNAESFAPKDAVTLGVAVKNVPKLIVRIYEINTLTYFLTQNRQLNTDLNLDGLVANVERTQSFDDAAGRSPFRREARSFDFPELKGKRGAWIVEIIGGGKSSRALIRKGQWEVIAKPGPAGDLLMVVDEAHQPVPDAVAWVDGRKLAPDEKVARIVVPFTAQPGDKPVVVATPAGDFASLTHFEHHAEEYRLDAQFHIEREQLLAGREATLAIRTTLLANNAQVTVKLVEEPKLTLTTVTLDNISTVKEIGAAEGLTLENAKDSTRTLTVPDRLASLTVTLTGKITSLTGGEKKEVSASYTWDINGIDRGPATCDGHLVHAAAGYFFDLLGKNGEAVPDRQVVFHFKHDTFKSDLVIPLRTDDHGRVTLGALTSIGSVKADVPDGQPRQWMLKRDDGLLPEMMHAKTGETLSIPWFGGNQIKHEEVSLLEKREETFVGDRFDSVVLKDNYIELPHLAAGDYQLSLQHGGYRRIVQIKVGSGGEVAGWILNDARSLQASAAEPLQIDPLEIAGDAITIHVRNATPYTRVQVVADRFVPAPGKDIVSELSWFQRTNPSEGAPSRRPNLYASGRAIGDEYRYILDRKFNKLYPGNMLTRPGLLLNPWEVRSTDIADRALQEAEGLARKAGDADSLAHPAMASPQTPPAGASKQESGSDLDFLASAAAAIFNLVPDANGIVRIDRKALGDRQYVQVYAEDRSTAVWRSVGLPEQHLKLHELRLARNLDPQKAFVETRKITTLTAGQTITISDVLSADMETYDSLSSLYALLSTLTNDANLRKFSFILDWPKLKQDEKQGKYSEFACHELNFFLSRKDPQFFKDVIQPYLRNKKDKTFMDDYLLDADLKSYLDPWSYGRLNMAERALLGRRVPGEAAATARHLRESWQLLPPSFDQADQLFDSALRAHGRAFFGGGIAGAAVRNDLYPFNLEKSKMSASAIAGLQPQSAASESAGRQLRAAGKKALAEGKGEQSIERLASADRRDALKDMAKQANKRDEALDVELGEADGTRLRKAVRKLYGRIGPTKEWAENNYYELPIARQNADLIPINAFWRDYAEWNGDGLFASTHVAEASRSFSEAMLALGLIDLPFEAPKHQTHAEDGQFTLTAGGVILVFHKEITPAAPGGNEPEIMVSESFFKANDRWREEGNEKTEKYVSDEFLAGVVYGANVVVTNPTSSPRQADLLFQIPQGAIPVNNSKATDSKRMHLDPYTTQKLEYFFYFPVPAEQAFPHYPAHVSADGKALGAAKQMAFKVVRQLSKEDTESWEYISQYGSEDEVFAFLNQHNMARIDLAKVAWRARQSVDFLNKLAGAIARDHLYSDVIYSYGVYHNDAQVLAEWLRHQDAFLSQCGPFLDSPLVRIDPIERRAYEHLEYSPLINQRAHRLGAEYAIPNTVLRSQYQALLQILAHKQALAPIDRMSVVYCLFLQDRADEALAMLKTIPADALPTRLQYDYFRCYAGFYEEQLAEARGIASQYASYPVDRWRKLFTGVLAQLDEIQGKPAVAQQGGKDNAESKADREAMQGELAATEPTFDFQIQNRRIAMTWKNLGEVTINYYLMDPELLFSSSPFVTQDPARFSIVKPARSVKQALLADHDSLEIPLPPEYERSNVLVEILGAGQRKAEAYHANTLRLNLVENYGRLDLHDSAAGKPVAKAYVKVYARLQNGQIRFYKDGYTDLRGKFDYASLNSGAAESVQPVARQSAAQPASGFDYKMLLPGESGEVERLSILILSDTNGALVKEANPPSE